MMAPKDDSELKTIQRACQLTGEIYSKYLKDQIMEVIDADKVIRLSFLFYCIILFVFFNTSQHASGIGPFVGKSTCGGFEAFPGKPTRRAVTIMGYK